VTRDDVEDLLGRGLNRKEIADRLGLSKATVTYHARRLGRPVDAASRGDTTG
jgi:DNA-binding NarL/FixJ family response regulator